MKPKVILFGDEARKKISTGVDIIARAVTTTLSPKGRNVALGQPFNHTPKVIHDGVSVAKEIILEDQFENMGALLAREAAERTNEAVGDGTTTAILLTHEIVKQGMRKIDNGANPMFLKKGIDKAVKATIAEIKKLAEPLKPEDWEKVATISAQDESIGRKIVEALKLVGEKGIIEVKEGKHTEISIEHKEGMTYGGGYLSPYFCKSPKELVAEIENAYILITDQKLKEFSQLVPLLNQLSQISKNLVVIADAVEDEALSGLVINKLHGKLNALAVRAPFYGQRRKDMLEDIAVLTGGTVISEEKGLSLEDENILDYLGQAELVKADKHSTSIIGGKGDPKKIKEHIAKLENELKKAELKHEKESLTTRLAKLTGGVAIIYVGADSESEMKNLKERVIDAKEATRSAIRSGIVAGGGVTLLRATERIEVKAENEDEGEGIEIIRKLGSAPIRKLAENAGYDPGFVLHEIRKNQHDTFGFNVVDGEFGDMVKQGIIEPADLAVASLKHAASAAGMILTTDCLVDERRDDAKSGTKQ